MTNGEWVGHSFPVQSDYELVEPDVERDVFGFRNTVADRLPI
jgi:hypothetical protein